MDIYNKIQKICVQKNISIYSLEKKAGFSRNSIHSWKTSTPSADKILRVANCLDVSADYILGNSDNPVSHKSTISPDAMRLIETYERLELSPNLVQLTTNFMEWIKANIHE